VRSRVVASLSVEHRRPRKRALVGKLAVLVGSRGPASVANAPGRCRFVCFSIVVEWLAHTLRPQQCGWLRRDGVSGDGADGAVWTRKGLLLSVKLGSLAGVGSSAAGGLASVVSVSELVSGSPRRVGIANPLRRQVNPPSHYAERR
jgi:hypothetical protein